MGYEDRPVQHPRLQERVEVQKTTSLANGNKLFHQAYAGNPGPFLRYRMIQGPILSANNEQPGGVRAAQLEIPPCAPKSHVLMGSSRNPMQSPAEVQEEVKARVAPHVASRLIPRKVPP